MSSGTVRGGGRPGLSLDRIVTETLRLIDEQGIAAASMRTVAQRLGVRAMSLYRHVENREQLFDAVVERIVSELDHDAQIPASASGGWREYLTGLAWGVRRYGRAHPHAFPLVATRPPSAPWVNPPLRSLRWIEALLGNLAAAGFTDDQILFTYRSFNSFLLGYLLLETSAMVIADPQPGDGSYQAGGGGGGGDGHDPVDPADPVPASVSPTRTSDEREAIADADTPAQLIDALGDVPEGTYPTIHRLRAGLTEDRFEAEFSAGLEILLDRIGRELGA